MRGKPEGQKIDSCDIICIKEVSIAYVRKDVIYEDIATHTRFTVRHPHEQSVSTSVYFGGELVTCLRLRRTL